MKKKPKHFLPNIITLTNMFLGFVAIGLIIKNQPLKAGVAIIIAGMLDVFDGKIARLNTVQILLISLLSATLLACILKRILNPLISGA